MASVDPQCTPICASASPDAAQQPAPFLGHDGVVIEWRQHIWNPDKRIPYRRAAELIRLAATLTFPVVIATNQSRIATYHAHQRPQIAWEHTVCFFQKSTGLLLQTEIARERSLGGDRGSTFAALRVKP